MVFKAVERQSPRGICTLQEYPITTKKDGADIFQDGFQTKEELSGSGRISLPLPYYDIAYILLPLPYYDIAYILLPLPYYDIAYILLPLPYYEIAYILLPLPYYDIAYILQWENNNGAFFFLAGYVGERPWRPIKSTKKGRKKKAKS